MSGLRSIGRSLLVNGLGPFFVYRFALKHFPSGSILPIVLATIVPVIGLAIGFVRQRAIDVIALVALAQVGTNLGIALLTHSTRAVIIGHSLHHAMLGLVFAASALTRRPLLLTLARQFIAGDDREREARFDASAARPGALSRYRWITLIWAAVLCLETLVLLAASRVVSTTAFLVISPLATIAVFAGLIVGSLWQGRRRLQALDAAG